MEITPYLERLEEAVDPAHVARSEALQRRAWHYEPVERIPTIISFVDKVSKIREAEPPDWPVFHYDEVYRDPAAMLLDELSELYVGALVGDDKMYTIRANYGVGILPSVFGCEIELRSEDDLPWVEPLTWDQVKEIIDRGVPDLTGGLMGRVTETEAYFREMLAPYPKLSQVVHITVPDIQGPFNSAGEILGPRIYADLYDHPEVMHDLLDLLAETYIQLVHAQKAFLGEAVDGGYNWHFWMRGGGRISEDHALMISSKQYDEFVLPYNERIYAAFEGGYILYCGEGKQVLDNILNIPSLTGIYFWSEDLDDLLLVYPKARERGICVMWYGEPWHDRTDMIDTGLIWERVASSMEEAQEWAPA